MFSNYVIERFDNGFQVNANHTDMAKAFDRIHHDTLSTVLSSFGLGGALLLWINSYLKDRQKFFLERTG